MATFEFKKEATPGQDPVKAVAEPIAYVGLVAIIAVVVVALIVGKALRRKK